MRKFLLVGVALSALLATQAEAQTVVKRSSVVAGEQGVVQVPTTDSSVAKIQAVVVVNPVTGAVVPSGSDATAAKQDLQITQETLTNTWLSRVAQLQAQTTSGQYGVLIQCAVTASDASYTAATTNAPTCTTTGRLRVGLSSATNIVPGTSTVTNADLVACVYRTPVAWTVGWVGAIQCDSAGNLMVSGTVAVTGTFWQATQPVSGTFWQATQPVSMATAPVLVAGSAIIGKVGIDQTTPGTTNLVAASQSGTWTVQPGNTANTTAWKVDGSAVTQPVSSVTLATAAKQPALGTAGSSSTDVISVQGIASGTPVIIGGNVASGATDSGNPIKAGCYGNSSAPTAVTNGQRANIWCGLSGQTVSALYDSSNAVFAAIVAAGTDNGSNTVNGLNVHAHGKVWNGTQWVRTPGDVGGAVIQQYALTGSRWQYAAAAGGISNTTTAVTVAAAAGGSLRNYITGMQCTSSALGVATEFAIRDGAGGTVIWRAYITTTGWISGAASFDFSGSPLKGTANTLTEMLTLTASVTGPVYCNLQGYTAL